MATLTGDIRMWSLREDVVVRDADFSAVRYQDKSNVSKERVYYEAKKRYIEARGGCVIPKNSRPTRLREAIKEFEELVAVERVVWSGWQQQQRPAAATAIVEEEPCRVYQMVLSSGVVCSAVVSAVTGDLKQLSSDKYLTGKLLSEHPAHAVITNSHLLISYNDSRLSVLHMDSYTPPATLPVSPSHSNNSSDSSIQGGSLLVPPPISSRHPSLYTAQLAGPHGRRFQRKLSASITGEMVLVWWERTEDEVYPWSPIERDRRDRANILVYSLQCGELSLLCHARSHLPPLSVAFSTRDASVVLSVEQGFDKKGGVTILSCVYKIIEGSMERVSVTSIPLEAPVSSHSYSPLEDRLLLACNNGVIALHSHSSTHLTRSALSPTHVSWLQPGALLVVANDRGQLQCFDMALSLVRIQLGGEDGLPVRLLDLTDYFCHQPSLCSVSWAPAPVVMSGGGDATNTTTMFSSTQTDDRYLDLTEQYSSLLLLLHYARGPLTCIRINAPHFSLTHPISNFKTDDLNTSSVITTNKSDASHDLHNTSQISCATTTSNNSSNSSFSKSSQFAANNDNSTSNNNSTSSNSNNTSDNCVKTDGGGGGISRPRLSHFCSVSPDVLLGEYLRHAQVEEAINLCGSLCWEQDGGLALKCVSSVVNYIIRRAQLFTRRSHSSTDSGVMSDLDTTTAQTNATASVKAGATSSTDNKTTLTTNLVANSKLFATASGPDSSKSSLDTTLDSVTYSTLDKSSSSGGGGGIATTGGGVVAMWESRVLGMANILSSGFLSPSSPLSSTTEQQYGPPVRALARRLFFKLLRCNCLPSAYTVACDLGDPDCFIRLNKSAERSGFSQLASNALRRAESLRSSSSMSSSCCCSGSCSHGTSDTGSCSVSSSQSSCCSNEDCSHDNCYSSGSSSGSCTSAASSYSHSCSTCSSASESEGGSDSDGTQNREEVGVQQMAAPHRGEREGGDGRESEVISSGAARHTTDVPNSRPARAVYTQQTTGEPSPVPAPILPSATEGGPAANVQQQHHSSTITYYDPVSCSAAAASMHTPSFTSSSFVSMPSHSGVTAAVPVPNMAPSAPSTDASADAYEPIHFDNKNLHAQNLFSNNPAQNSSCSLAAYSEANKIISSADRFVASQYNSPQYSTNATSTYTSFPSVYPNTQSPSTLLTYSDTNHRVVSQLNSQPQPAVPGNPQFPISEDTPVAAITSQDGKITINITQNCPRKNVVTDSNHKSKNISANNKLTIRRGNQTGSLSHYNSTDHEAKTNRKIKHSSHENKHSSNDGKRFSHDRKHSGHDSKHISHDNKHSTNSHGSQNKKASSSNAFINRRSQRNMSDAMDAADSAIAALQQQSSYKHTGKSTSNYKHSANDGNDINTTSLHEAITSSNSNQDSNNRVSHSSKYHASKLMQNEPPSSSYQQKLDAGQHPSFVNHPQQKQHPSTLDAYQDTGYYNEDTIDEELNRNIYQELSTEEEEGGTVKVVHFGVV